MTTSPPVSADQSAQCVTVPQSAVGVGKVRVSKFVIASTPLPVLGADPYGLDADGDGVGCED